jgi:DNA repair photolyase
VAGNGIENGTMAKFGSDTPLGTPSGPRAHTGRGAQSHAEGRFTMWVREAADDGWEPPGEETRPGPICVAVDSACTIIARNDSPDIPFEQSLNPYRGCGHGCVYCYSRPDHAYLGLSPGLDFVTHLYFKPNAASLLEKELHTPEYHARPIALGTNTDPYQPIERRFRLTREILEALAACEHPVCITTKSALVERDLDLLARMAVKGLAAVSISIATLDSALARRLEPRAALPQRRLATIEALAGAGIPTGVMVAPVIPGLTDSDLEEILEESARAGARRADYTLLRLPHEVKNLFQEWLAVHAPLHAAHVMNLVRETHGGAESGPCGSARPSGTGDYAQHIARRFHLACQRLELDRGEPAFDSGRFHPPRHWGEQLPLFGFV